jgi:hypothetical protein
MLFFAFKADNCVSKRDHLGHSRQVFERDLPGMLANTKRKEAKEEGTLSYVDLCRA